MERDRKKKLKLEYNAKCLCPDKHSLLSPITEWIRLCAYPTFPAVPSSSPDLARNTMALGGMTKTGPLCTRLPYVEHGKQLCPSTFDHNHTQRQQWRDMVHELHISGICSWLLAVPGPVCHACFSKGQRWVMQQSHVCVWTTCQLETYLSICCHQTLHNTCSEHLLLHVSRKFCHICKTFWQSFKQCLEVSVPSLLKD